MNQKNNFEESLKFDKWIVEQFGQLANPANSFTISGSKLTELAHDIREKVIQETIKEIKTNIGLLRQWLNEDRITDLKKIVSNEDLERWLLKNLINLPKE